jgi:hypothetical protein
MKFRKSFESWKILDGARPSPHERTGGFRPTFLRSDPAPDRALSARLLLYSGEMVVPTSLMQVDSASSRLQDREELVSALAWLCTTYPLWQDGSLECADVGEHWKWRLTYEGLREEMPKEIRDTDWREIWGLHMEDPLVGLVRTFPRLNSDLISLSKAEDWQLRRLINCTPPDSRRVSNLTLLGRADLPMLGGSIAELVTLRLNEDAFAQWRLALGQSLEAVREYGGDEADPQRLAGAIQDELNEALSPIGRAVTRSRTLQALHLETRSLSVSALGAAGAGLGAGSADLPVLGGALAGLGDLGWAMYSAARQRKKDNLIWATYAALL